MLQLESAEIGIYNLDYFSIDIVGNEFIMGGKKYPLGQFTLDIANLSKDFVTELLYLGTTLNVIYHTIVNSEHYIKDGFITARIQIHRIIDLIKDIKPFCYFNITASKSIVDDVFSDENLKRFNDLNDEDIYQKFIMALELMKIYFYIPNDIANFGTVAINFTETFIQMNSRTKKDLAICAYSFFNDKDVLSKLENANPLKDTDGTNLRPRVTQVPIISFDKETKSPVIARRLYFGRLMDFLITEFFEAMQCGHYIWRCGVCDKYFLMRSARKQLYCSTVNERYGVPCSYVAKHPELVKRDLQRQKRNASPIYDIWRRRDNSIRKNKSLGKYSGAVSAEAKRIIDEKYERAQFDFDYAGKEYESEMNLKLIYDEAIKNVE